ncbi:MAG TPA: efflux RND transporter periplasmic adaptor subunit [bacterium]|nr:efflux RND transporter periplasmic adaptor subunit [bacterium]
MLKKKYIIIIILILIGIGIFYYFKNKNSAAGGKDSSEQKTGIVKRGDLYITVNSTGVTEPNLVVDVKSKAGGEIIKIPFEEGDEVKQGELLLELNPVDEQRNLSKAEAGLQEAEASLSIAKSNLNISIANYENYKISIESSLKSSKASFEEAKQKYLRNEKLYNEKLISTEQLESLKKSYIVAESQYNQALADSYNLIIKEKDINISKERIKTAEAGLTKAVLTFKDAQERIKETKIFAPMNGVIIQRNVAEGQIISSATSNAGGGTLLMKLADVSTIYVIADIDESDIGQIEPEQKVTITVDAYKDKKFGGIVERIKPLGVDNSNITVFKVKIKVTDADAKLLFSGMTANVEILVNGKEDVLYVPYQAVKSKRGKNGVYILASGDAEEPEKEEALTLKDEKTKTKKIKSKSKRRHKFVEVETGITNGEFIEIISDEISENDVVLLENPEFNFGKKNGNNKSILPMGPGQRGGKSGRNR